MGTWFTVVYCETDSAEALRLIHNADDTHLYSTIITEIRDWLRRDWNVTISHVLREANSCVDYLAKDGAHGNENLRVLPHPPAGLLPLLREDFMGTLSMRS